MWGDEAGGGSAGGGSNSNNQQQRQRQQGDKYLNYVIVFQFFEKNSLHCGSRMRDVCLSKDVCQISILYVQYSMLFQTVAKLIPLKS